MFFLGYIHLFATNEQAAFNAYPQATEFSDPVSIMLIFAYF